jgi:hypothetical protein
MTYVDAPELLNAVEADDLLEQLIPVLLAAGWLGEPQGPGVLQSVLNVEILRVVKDGHDLVTVRLGAIGGVGDAAIGRDGDGVERDGLGRVGGDCGHGLMGVSELSE